MARKPTIATGSGLDELSKAPEYLNLEPFAVKEWERVCADLKKRGMLKPSDRALLEFYVVNYQFFVTASASVKELTEEYQRAKERDDGSSECRANLKYLRQNITLAQDTTNKAIMRGLGLSQKLYMNPNDRKKGKVDDGEDKTGLDAFMGA